MNNEEVPNTFMTKATPPPHHTRIRPRKNRALRRTRSYGTQYMGLMNSFFGPAITILIFSASVFLMFKLSMNMQKTSLTLVAFILSGSMTYFLLRMMLSFLYAPVTRPPREDHLVSVIIPSFNESRSSVVETINCLIAQDYPIHEIFFIDDGSDSDEAFSAINEMPRKKTHSIHHASRFSNQTYPKNSCASFSRE